jgi:hypothetical protein
VVRILLEGLKFQLLPVASNIVYRKFHLLHSNYNSAHDQRVPRGCAAPREKPSQGALWCHICKTGEVVFYNTLHFIAHYLALMQLGFIFSVVLNNLVSILYYTGGRGKRPPAHRLISGGEGGDHTHQNILRTPQKVFPPRLEKFALPPHWMTVICDWNKDFEKSKTKNKWFLTLSRPFTDRRFHITLQVNVSNVNISASIYPPLKQNPPLKSSQNKLSNGGSTAVKTLHKPKQS